MVTRAVAEKGTTTRMSTWTGTRTRSGRGERRRKTSRNRTSDIDAIRDFHSHASSSLQTEVGACGHREVPLGRPGVCTRTSYRGDTSVRGMERSESGRGPDQSWAGGTEGGTESGAGTGT